MTGLADGLEAYVYTDHLFCWVGVVLARNPDEAQALAAQKGWDVRGLDLEVLTINRPGVLAEGGGNG